MRYLYIPMTIMLSVLLGSCVSRQRYVDLENTLRYYKEQALAADSVNYANNRLSGETNSLENQMSQLIMDKERLTATNISLNRNYQDMLGRYNKLLDQSKDIVSTYSTEQTSLQSTLAQREAEIARRERDLRQLELQLEQQGGRLPTAGPSTLPQQPVAAQQDPQVTQLRNRLIVSNSRLQQLRTGLQQALTGYTTNDLSVEERNGRLYLTLSEELLFAKGSSTLNYRGSGALTQAAGVILQYPELQIMVEGHTDNDGNADINWNLSTQRAITVVKSLISNGVKPERMTAAGRAFYAPLLPNTSEANKMRNRRTEIVLLPDYGDLYTTLRN